jgi:osmotically-inducible protein OsmY
MFVMGPRKKAAARIQRGAPDEPVLEHEKRGSWERTDGDIVRAVLHALRWDVLVPHERIRATVSNGVVTLEGTVDHLSQYHDAARVRALPGVRAVNNLIAVEPTRPRLVPLAVRSAVELVLKRCAVDAARRVQIAVAAGKVTLSGDVPSLRERRAVERAVGRMPGVLKVDNLLGIQAGLNSDPLAVRPALFPGGGTEARTSVVGDASGE